MAAHIDDDKKAISEPASDHEHPSPSPDVFGGEHTEMAVADGKVTIKAVLVILAINLIYIAQGANLVGTGAFSRQVGQAIGSPEKAFWLTAVLTVVSAGLGPPVSAASDFFGRKWILVLCNVAGFVGVLVTARAKTMNIAILGEVICGTSYWALPLLHAVPSEIIPRKYRPYAQGTLTCTAGLGALFGCLFGGSLMRHNPANFRIFFEVCAGMFALGVLTILFLYNPPPFPLQKLPLKEKLRRIDWVGSILVSASLVLFCIGLSWVYNPYRWKDAHVLAPLVIGIALMVITAIHQIFYKKDGLFNHRLFKHGRNFPIALVGQFVEGFTFFIANNYFAFQVGLMYQEDLFIVAAVYSIGFGVMAITCPLCAYFCTKTKTVRPAAVAAFATNVVFYALMASTTPGSKRAVWGYTPLLGFGIACCWVALITVAQLDTPPDLIASTSGFVISIRMVGGVFGLSIAAAVFNPKLEHHLLPSIAAKVLPAGLPASSVTAFAANLEHRNIPGLMKVPGVTPAIIEEGLEGLREGYMFAFRDVWIMAAAVAGFALFVVLFLIDPKAQYNNVIDAPIDKFDEKSETTTV